MAARVPHRPRLPARGPRRKRPLHAAPGPVALDDDAWRLVAALEAGLPLVPRPFDALAQRARLPLAGCWSGWRSGPRRA